MPYLRIGWLSLLMFPGLPTLAGGQQAVAPGGSKVLEGRWQVELFLDPRSMRSPPPAEKVSGEIAFGTGSWWGNSERFGRYAVDLRPFFGRFFAAPANVKAFSAADTSFLTEASGGIAGDSVVIDFMPRVDHLGLTFRGRFYGDSARGRWHRRGTEGYGPFVLRRVSKDPVAVAAIPDPAKQAAPQVAAKGRRTGGRRAAQAASAAKPPAPAPPPSTPAATVAATPAASGPAAAARGDTRSGAPASVAARAREGRGVSMEEATRVQASTPPGRAAAAAAPATAPATAPAAAPAAAPQGALVAVTTSPLVATAPARGDTAGTGALRVRIFDRASQRWFVTKYALKLPDGNWMLANLRTGAGADGWGPPVRRAPGRHEVEIGDFVCGDRIWFLRDKITHAVEIRPGETTDVSVDVDLTAAPAKPSLDNRSGAKCSAPPGTPR